MRRPLRALLTSSAALFALCHAETAQADCRGIWTKMCTPDSGSSRDVFVDVPIHNPVAEKLRADVQTYDQAMASIFEGTGSIEPFLGLPWPADEQELSRRADNVLATIWPEFRSNALEAELLRRQSTFYFERNAELRADIAGKRDLLARMERFLPERLQLLARNEEVLTEAREYEAEFTALALKVLNDRTSERAALATLLVFAPEPRVGPEELAAVAPISSLPGAQTPPEMYPPVDLRAAFAEPSPPEGYAQFIVTMPDPRAPLSDKLAMMQRAGSALQLDTLDVVSLGRLVPERRAEYEALRAEREQLNLVSAPIAQEAHRVDFGIERAMAQIHTAVENQELARTTIVTELLADIALDRAVGRIRSAIDEIAGSEGLSARIPANRSQALLDLARRGGHIALPIGGHAQAWDSFIEAQEQTLGVLERAEGFMLEAARLAASSSPEEMEAHLERVFASVQWQTVEYAKLSASGILPEGEDRSVIEDAFDRYIGKLRERHTGG